MLTKLERAKQFLPFDALSGLQEELRKREVEYVERKELSEEKKEEIEYQLENLTPGQKVIITYYLNNRYIKLKGKIIYINPIKKIINVSKVEIPLNNVYNIEITY